MSPLGQNAKSSQEADVFRCSPNIGHSVRARVRAYRRAPSPIAPVSESVLGKLQITITGGHRMTAGVNDAISAGRD